MSQQQKLKFVPVNTSQELLTNRAKLESQIREFFVSRNYLEVRTPLLVQSPGMEPHIFPLQVHASTPVFLPTSPEFGMKKLLARGLDKIFQLAPSFRVEPHSPQHRAEFLMLEWYQKNFSLIELADETEDLIRHLAESINQHFALNYQNQRILLQKPWPRFRVVDLFEKHLNIDLRKMNSAKDLYTVCRSQNLPTTETDSWDDLYFKLWLNKIEPRLPKNTPCFVTHFPVAQSSLCQTIQDEQGFLWANRFELFIAGIELANAFDELTNSSKQRENFRRDQELRKSIYGNTRPESPIDEVLLQSIGMLPQTSGIALGVDRLIMLLLDQTCIENVLWLEPYWLNEIT